jgi:hypothetical protein
MAKKAALKEIAPSSTVSTAPQTATIVRLAGKNTNRTYASKNTTKDTILGSITAYSLKQLEFVCLKYQSPSKVASNIAGLINRLQTGIVAPMRHIYKNLRLPLAVLLKQNWVLV